MITIRLNKQGSTRYVLMTRKIVIKIPSLYSYKHFLNGLLANLQEVQFSTRTFECLTPVILGNRFGLFVVQKRLQPVKHRGLFWVEHKKLMIESEIPNIHLSDIKPENYGYDGGKLKRLDYGS